MQTLLETERLILQRLTADDFDALVELDADPEVTRFITGGIPEFDRPMLEAWLREYERSPGYGTFAAVERESGEFLGWFHLRPEAGHEGEPELGYRLRRSAWGKGYATEGSRALIELAFTRLDAARVWASTMVVNVASRRVMEKAGMRLVRHFRADWPYSIPGDEEGDVEYAITRAEWETNLRLAAPATVTPPTRYWQDLPRPLPPREGKPLSQLLEEMRDEERG